MGYKVLAQIALIIVSIILITVYIRPTFADIGELQDTMFEYQDAAAKAEEFNALLSSLMQKKRSYSSQDLQALNNFLPNEVDDAQVLRDLESMLDEYNIQYDALALASADELGGSTNEFEFEGEDGEEVEQDLLYSRDFKIAVQDTYENIKIMLALLESNSYPLEIVKMEMAYEPETEGEETQVVTEDLFAADLIVRVHSMSYPEIKDDSLEVN